MLCTDELLVRDDVGSVTAVDGCRVVEDEVPVCAELEDWAVLVWTGVEEDGCGVLLCTGVDDGCAVLLCTGVDDGCGVLLCTGVDDGCAVLLCAGVDDGCGVLLCTGVDDGCAVLLCTGVVDGCGVLDSIEVVVTNRVEVIPVVTKCKMKIKSYFHMHNCYK